MKQPVRIRLINDPGRNGLLTGRSRDRRGQNFLQVIFPDGTQWVPENQIEYISEMHQDPIDLLAEGRIGHAADLRRTITHVRLSGRLANIIYSMDTTGTDFYAYQFKPVLKLLNTITSGILIADEVGLGKTIEAGLIWTELRSRFDFRRIFVLCPAFLREKWQLELSHRFGVMADIVDAQECFKKLYQSADEGPLANFALIGSMQGLRPRRDWISSDEEDGRSNSLAKFLSARQHEEPLIDLLVIDEAHYMRNRETMTSAIGKLLRDTSQYVLLLTATPIHLKCGDLFQLMNLVDEDTFDHPGAFDDILRANEPLVNARDLLIHGNGTRENIIRLLQRAQSHPLLQGNRQIASLIAELPDDVSLTDKKTISELAFKLDTVNLLGHVVSRTRKRDVIEWRIIRDPKSISVPLTEPERAFYETVTAVVREYCQRGGAHEGFLLCTPQRQMSSSMPAALRFWKERGIASENEIFEDVGNTDIETEYEPGPLVQTLIERANEFANLEELFAHDSKYEILRDKLREFFKSEPKEKVIIFSYFRATLKYLKERLENDGIRSLLLLGGMEDKNAIVREFQERKGPLVLLSSEVGSEGIDLQFCWVIINYDLPWNPMRVEQRIGRADRLGQKSNKVVIWNMFYEDTIDSRIYNRLLSRLNIFHQSLGALEPVIGPKIRDLTMELFSNRLTPHEEEQRIEQTAQALENIRNQEEDLENQAAHLVAYGDYILNQIKAARELSRRIDNADIQTYVTDFLRLHYPGCELHQISDGSLDWDIALSAQARLDLEEFIRNQRLDLRTALIRMGSTGIRYRFENTAIPKHGGRVELISQFHPLVRFISHRLKESDQQPHPALAVEVDKKDISIELPAGIYVFSIQLWSFNALQDIERIHYAAVLLAEKLKPLAEDDAERLIVAAARAGSNWIGAQNAIDFKEAAEIANDVCMANSDEAFQRFDTDLRRQNEDRADLQEQTLEKYYQRQRQNLNRILEEHQRKERSSLVKATEGRIRALDGRVEIKKLEIGRRRKVSSRKIEVCVGVIRLKED